MFDFLLALTAIGGAIVDGLSVKTAVNNPSGYNADFVPPEKPCFEDEERKRLLKEAEDKEARRKAQENLARRKERKIYSRAEVIAKQKPCNDVEEKPTALAEWILNHEDVIITALETGTHIISSENLKGINPSELADFLFEQSCIESVSEVPEGLEVITR